MFIERIRVRKMGVCVRTVTVLVLSLTVIVLKASAQTGPSLQDFQSADPSVRMTAFYALIHP